MPASLPKGVEQLPSGAYRARLNYRGKTYRATFDTPRQAEGWIQRTRRDLVAGLEPTAAPAVPEPTPEPTAPLFRDYATTWLADRPLKPSTKHLYEGIIEGHLVPKWGAIRLDRITVEQVRTWHRNLLPGRPTRKAHTYALLRTILGTAVRDDLIPANPCRVVGGGNAKRESTTEIPSMDRIRAVIAAMPEGKYRTLVLLAVWCGLRQGELLELRRRDLILDADGIVTAIHVSRGVYRYVIGDPKTKAGDREVSVPPHIRAELTAWLSGRPAARSALLFPGAHSDEHIAPDTLRDVFHRACAKAGVSMRFHDLRHVSATLAARSGATVGELQARIGHSTPHMALRYQGATKERDAAIAAAMSAHAEPDGVVVRLPRPA